MLKFIAKRLANYVVMLFVAISCTYFLASGFMRPRSNYESRTPRPPAASINRSLDLANINDHTNIFTRYWRWLTGVVTRWDWGLSPDLGSVNGALAPRIVASTELVTIATVLSIVLGVALGIYTAQRQYKWQDRLFGTTATFFLVIPTAVFALLVVMLAIFINGASGFRLFYVTGLSSYTGNNWFLRLADFGQHIILPTIVLTILGMVSYHLTQRTYLLDEMHADYVRTARAKGLTRRQAIRRHALRASLIPTACGTPASPRCSPARSSPNLSSPSTAWAGTSSRPFSTTTSMPRSPSRRSAACAPSPVRCWPTSCPHGLIRASR